MSARPNDAAPDGRGWVERFKAFRDSRSLKPLLCLIIYLVVPLMGIQLILVQYPDLDPARFRMATILIVPISLLIVGVALVQERHPKGELIRLYLDGLYVVLTMLWMLSLIGGSTVIRSSYDGHPFTVDITPLVILTIITAAANFAHDLLEYRHYRSGAERPVHATAGERAGSVAALSPASDPARATGGHTLPPVVACSTGPTPAPASSSLHGHNCSLDVDIAGTQLYDYDGSAASCSLVLEPHRRSLPARAPPDALTARPTPDPR